MSRCYLDTNFLYVHLRSPRDGRSGPLESWRARAIARIAAEGGVISALVLDELAYRLVLAWLRDDGHEDPLSRYRMAPQDAMDAARSRLRETWGAVDSLALEMKSTDAAVVARAKSLMDRPALAPRDAFHAAHALEAGCGIIVSSDESFDLVPGLERLGP